MSQENVEIIRGAIDAYNRGDFDAVLKNAAPDFEFDLSRAVGPDIGIYRLDQMPGFIREVAASWESLRLEPDEFIDAGEQVVMPFTVHAQGRDGIAVRQTRVTWLWTIRDGAVVRVCMYQERQEALEAAGLSR
jgi:ketosteroid isomerase-like protein